MEVECVPDVRGDFVESRFERFFRLGARLRQNDASFKGCASNQENLQIFLGELQARSEHSGENEVVYPCKFHDRGLQGFGELVVIVFDHLSVFHDAQREGHFEIPPLPSNMLQLIVTFQRFHRDVSQRAIDWMYPAAPVKELPKRSFKRIIVNQNVHDAMIFAPPFDSCMMAA